MSLQAYWQGFSRRKPVSKPKLKHTENGDESICLPSPPKNISINRKPNKNSKKLNRKGIFFAVLR